MILYIFLIIISFYIINSMNNKEISFNHYIHKIPYYIIQKDVYVSGIISHSHKNTILLIIYNKYRNKILIN